MFDVGFSELLLIGIVALVVLGPERLPKVARTAGHLLGRLQRYVNDVKADINREIQLEELKKLQADVSESARKIEDQVRSEFVAAKSAVEDGSRTAFADLEASAQINEPVLEVPAPAASDVLTPEVAAPATSDQPNKATA